MPGEVHHPESAERVEWTETRNLAAHEGERFLSVDELKNLGFVLDQAHDAGSAAAIRLRLVTAPNRSGGIHLFHRVDAHMRPTDEAGGTVLTPEEIKHHDLGVL